MKNTLKIFFCIYSFTMYSQEVFQGQYRSEYNSFTISNQNKESFTFLQLILYNDNTYKLHTETRLFSKSNSDYYVLDCSEHFGKWNVKNKHLFLTRDTDKQLIEFLIKQKGKNIIFKNSKRIKIYKASVIEEFNCTQDQMIN